MYITGSVGTGGYFVLIYIQIIIVFPLLHYIIVRYKKIGLLLTLFVNVLFELCVWIGVINANDLHDFYILCCLRYLIFVGIGIYIFYYGTSINNKLLIVFFLLGCIYIISYAYLGWKPLFVTYWSHSSFYTSLFIMPIVQRLLKFNDKPGDTHFGKLLSKIGQNSFYIFCVQMAWFTSRYSLRIGSIPILIMCISSVFICTSVGILFGDIIYKLRNFIK